MYNTRPHILLPAETDEMDTLCPEVDIQLFLLPPHTESVKLSGFKNHTFKTTIKADAP